MDILISSNLERLIYSIAGEDGKVTSEFMKELAENGAYTISEDMKSKLDCFCGGYCDESKTADTIKRIYENDGYVIDTHTAVAAGVYADYRKETGDNTVSVIASTASPYKFTRSVMNAISNEYDKAEDFELVDMLCEISKVKVPNAIEEIRTAPVLHDRVCDKSKMQETVEDILGL